MHRLEGHTGGLEALNTFLQEQGVLLNGEGGITKVRGGVGGGLVSGRVAHQVG